MFSLVINEKRIDRLERIGMEWNPEMNFVSRKGLTFLARRLAARPGEMKWTFHTLQEAIKGSQSIIQLERILSHQNCGIGT